MILVLILIYLLFGVCWVAAWYQVEIDMIRVDKPVLGFILYLVCVALFPISHWVLLAGVSFLEE